MNWVPGWVAARPGALSINDGELQTIPTLSGRCIEISNGEGYCLLYRLKFGIINLWVESSALLKTSLIPCASFLRRSDRGSRLRQPREGLPSMWPNVCGWPASK